ncbi:MULTISPECIES: hypothetical protein [Pantoea]|nr:MULTISPECIES: hypothetical protein [Pantoea]
MSQQTRSERADISQHLQSLRTMTAGMDAMQAAVDELNVLQKLSAER